MKKKIVLFVIATFSLGFIGYANQTVWLDCIGHDVPVNTVDRDYFENDDDYYSFIIDLMEIYCP